MLPPLVIDTNVVLDLFVFRDEQARPVLQGLEDGRLRWLATAAMRAELERVLAYPQLAPRLAFHDTRPAEVMGRFDRHATSMDEPAKAPVSCSDPDDQKFVDLAVAHGACLLSKDRAVLAMKKRLAALGVTAAPALQSPAG